MNYEIVLIVVLNVSFGLLCIYKWREAVNNKYVFDYTPAGYLKIYDKKEVGILWD